MFQDLGIPTRASPHPSWFDMTPGRTLPRNAINSGGKLNGCHGYIGKVYDAEDATYYVGTALPMSGTCTYVTRRRVLKTTDTYQVLCGEQLEFQLMDRSGYCVVCHYDENNDKAIYCARVVEGANTYIGWADFEIGAAFIPREPPLLASKVVDGYDTLVDLVKDLYVAIDPPAPPQLFR